MPFISWQAVVANLPEDGNSGAVAEELSAEVANPSISFFIFEKQKDPLKCIQETICCCSLEKEKHRNKETAKLICRNFDEPQI